MTAFHWKNLALGASTALPGFEYGPNQRDHSFPGSSVLPERTKNSRRGSPPGAEADLVEAAAAAGGGPHQSRRPHCEKSCASKRARLKCAFRFVLGADGEYLAWIGGAQKDFACCSAGDAGDLRRACFGELRKHAVAVDSEQSAVVAGARQDAAVRSEAEGVDDVVARGPEFVRRAFGRKSIDAAGKGRRESEKRCLLWPLTRVIVPIIPPLVMVVVVRGELMMVVEGVEMVRCFSPMAAT